MSVEDKIDIDIFKLVNRAIAESNNLTVMTSHLAQLLVVALGIKGCTLSIFNPESKELETLGSFGLSIKYMTKGPVLADKSIGDVLKGEPVIVANVADTKLLQYPEFATEEGISAIISIPIMFYGEPIGALRLYHFEVWEISERDVDSLLVLGENVGLAMVYLRILNVLQSIKGAIDDVHPIWLKTRSD
jgi:transcriptional regulator with GAF, ATPase, and Fis domain